LLSYNLVNAKIRKKSIYLAIKKYVGISNPSWKKDLIIGMILFLVGFGASFFTNHIFATSIQLFDLMNYLLEDYFALISMFGTIVGALFVYSSFQSALSIFLIQSSYSSVIKSEKRDIVVEKKELKEKLEELKTLIETYRKEGFDITQAYNVYVSIPQERFEERDNKDDIEIGDSISNNVEKDSDEIEEEFIFIEQSLDKLDNVLQMLKGKIKSAESNWEMWASKITDELKKSNEVPLSNLTFIPLSLRIWAANRFIRERSIKGLFLEGQILKRKSVAPIKMVKSVVDSSSIINAVILKDGAPYISIVNEGSKTVFLALFMKLSSYLKTFLKRSNEKEYKYLMGIGNDKLYAMFKKENLESLIICPTDKFKESFERWKEVLSDLD